MFKTLRRLWRYLGTSLGMELERAADPKVQLEQAISEAREQHRVLTEHAANVIANQTQLQYRLDRAIEDLGKTTTSARQALVLGDEARRAGNETKSTSLNQAAEGFAARIIQLEREVDDLRRSVLDASSASDRARRAVGQNSIALQKKLAERERLLSRLDQAAMQEQMNSAMAQLTTSLDDEVPTLDEVRRKIDQRLANAQAMTELREDTVDSNMLEVEHAQHEAETRARLRDLRSQLGLDSKPAWGGPETGSVKARARTSAGRKGASPAA
jgi:phage shock protein A